MAKQKRPARYIDPQRQVGLLTAACQEFQDLVLQVLKNRETNTLNLRITFDRGVVQATQIFTQKTLPLPFFKGDDDE